MEVRYSKEWIELINKKEELDKISFSYNKIDKNKRKHDLRKALEETDLLGQLLVVKMMGEGYIFPNSIELVLEETVKIAITGHEECAAWAGIALNHVDMKKCKNKIIELINFYTEKNLDDNAVFHQAWLLMYKLGFKRALIDYIRKYKKYMEGEFDETDLSDIKNMLER